MNPARILIEINRDLARLRECVECWGLGWWSNEVSTHAQIATAKAKIDILEEYRAWLESELTQAN